ncbi:MAG: hypothetical protein Q9167_007637 [Letrouitia subvulpina]
MPQNSNPLVVEDDLIPRPLRIVKRRNKDSNECRCFGAVGSQPESLYADLCQPEFPQQDRKMLVSSQTDVLYVPKKRKDNSASANSVTASVNPTTNALNANIVAHSAVSANSHLTRSKYPFNNLASPWPSYSATSNKAHRNTWYGRSTNPSSLTYPGPLNQRRACTMENPRRKLEKAPIQRSISSTDNSRRKETFKQRVSRMMSGLTGTPRHQNPKSMISSPIATNQSMENSNLDATLSVSSNPLPPLSTGNNLAMDTPYESANAGWSSQTLHTPKNVSILRPEIRIIPQNNFLDFNGKENISVALEVNAVCGNKNTQEPPLVGFGLEMVIIIDNSPFTSPATLMANSEATRFLTLLMDPVKDRLAILCTNCSGSENLDRRIILALEPPFPDKSKRALDSIKISPDFSDSWGLQSAALKAISLLEKSTSRRPESGPIESVSGHIVVFSSNLEGFSQDILNHDKIQSHLINAGVVPWKSGNRIRANGSKLQSMLTEELSLQTCINDIDPFSISNGLRALIGDARKGVLHGKVTGLSLTIEPASHSYVEIVHQVNRIASISPGENIVAALLRLSGGPKTTEELQEKVLTTILSAKLEFKHSLLPNTRSVVTEESQLWNGRRSSNDDLDECKIFVHNRLIFHIATHQPPRQAIQSLIEEFGNEGVQSACPGYFRLVVKELKHHAHIIERFDILGSRRPVVQAVHRRAQSEQYGQELRPQPLSRVGHQRTYSTVPRSGTANQLPLSISAVAKPMPIGNSWSEARRPGSGLVTNSQMDIPRADSPVLNNHLQQLERDARMVPPPPPRSAKRNRVAFGTNNNENLRPGPVEENPTEENPLGNMF